VLAVLKEKTGAGKVVRPAPKEIPGTRNRRAPLVASPYFVVEMLDLKDSQEFRTGDDSGKNSVQILIAVEGCGVVEAAGAEPVTLAKGDAVVVPASMGQFSVRPQWSVEFLKSSLPGKAMPEPTVRM
jgi:mannose-6-phosphate isomerase class I